MRNDPKIIGAVCRYNLKRGMLFRTKRNYIDYTLDIEFFENNKWGKIRSIAEYALREMMEESPNFEDLGEDSEGRSITYAFDHCMKHGDWMYEAMRELENESKEYLVSLYQVTQHYGGPEEGGWWYHNRKYLATVNSFTDVDTACAYMTEYRKGLEEENKQREKGVNQSLADMPDDDNYNHSMYPEGYIPLGQLGNDEITVTMEPWCGYHQDTERPRYE